MLHSAGSTVGRRKHKIEGEVFYKFVFGKKKSVLRYTAVGGMACMEFRKVTDCAYFYMHCIIK